MSIHYSIVCTLAALYILFHKASPQQTSDEGFKNFIRHKLSAFTDYIATSGLDPAPPIVLDVRLAITSGLFRLTGSLNNLTAVGLSKPMIYVWDVDTSFTRNFLVFDVMFETAGISGTYAASGLLLDLHPIGGQGSFSLYCKNFTIRYWDRLVVTNGHISISNAFTFSYEEFAYDIASVGGHFNGLFDLSPTFARYETEILQTIAAAMPKDVMGAPMGAMQRIFADHFKKYLGDIFSITPAEEIINWPAPTQEATTEESTTEESVTSEAETFSLSISTSMVTTDLTTEISSTTFFTATNEEVTSSEDTSTSSTLRPTSTTSNPALSTSEKPETSTSNPAIPPYFVATEKSDIDKIFIEHNENRSISCSAQGYPNPHVDWDLPTMDYISNSNNRVELNLTNKKDRIDGNETIESTIRFIKVLETDHRTYLCNASNSAGWDVQPFTVAVVPNKDDGSSSWTTILASAIALALLLPIMFLLYRRRQKTVRLTQIIQKFKFGETHDNNSILPHRLSCISRNSIETYKRILQLPFPQSLEILPERLIIDKSLILGKGAFGIVYMGRLDRCVDVAVKTMRKNSDESQLTALLYEAKMMHFVGKHPNIIQLLGVQLMGLPQGVVYVTIEYSARGSLESYLHTHRSHLETIPLNDPKYIIPGYNPVANRVAQIPTVQLITYSRQVCCALEFLESKKIIHGDLAARNVLLDLHGAAKISDFGLSRLLQDKYKKYVVLDKDTKIPWRGLPMETLRHSKFSTESDIWAFGVFMWEVFSFCQTPYSHVMDYTIEFVTQLENGLRLEDPYYATPEIYSLMTKCWERNPADRIKFQQLSLDLLSLYELEYQILGGSHKSISK